MASSPRAELSKNLFGNKHRLDVVAEIGKYRVKPPEQFHGKEIADKLEPQYGTPQSAIYKELHLYEEFDLIKRAGTRKIIGQTGKVATEVVYERVDSELMERLIGVAEFALRQALGPQAEQ